MMRCMLIWITLVCQGCTLLTGFDDFTFRELDAAELQDGGAAELEPDGAHLVDDAGAELEPDAGELLEDAGAELERLTGTWEVVRELQRNDCDDAGDAVSTWVLVESSAGAIDVTSSSRPATVFNELQGQRADRAVFLQHAIPGFGDTRFSLELSNGLLEGLEVTRPYLGDDNACEIRRHVTATRAP